MNNLKIAGIQLHYFVIIGIVLLAASFLGVLPTGMIGALYVMLFLGALLGVIGDNTPILKDYFGGGPILIIFASAALVYFNILPESITLSIKAFMETGSLRANDAVIGYKAGFLDFYIAALITGSILAMSRKLLVKASVRFLPTILGGVVVSLGLVTIVAAVMGYGAQEGLTTIGIPIIGGGMGAGAVPLAEIFSQAWGIDSAEILSKLVPAVALGNALAIVSAGLLDKLGKKYPDLSGEGKLIKIDDDDLNEDVDGEGLDGDVKNYGIGMLFAVAFFTFGAIVGKFVPGIHPYAWMIITVGIVKVIGVLPRKIELACGEWYKFVAGNFTSALLVGIGIAYTNLGQVIDSFSLTYLILVSVTVIGAIIGTMIVGKLVGFYPIEAAITAGLCMANMGGTGDVAVLGAAKRMELMPFAQISSRIGGTIILLIASVIVLIF